MRTLLSLTLAVMVCQTASAQRKITITGDKDDLANIVLAVPTGESKEAAATTSVVLADGTVLPAGFTEKQSLGGPGILCCLPKLNAGETASLTPLSKPESAKFGIRHEQGAPFSDIMFGNRLVVRYMNAPHDTSTKDRHELTFKIFHHVFDPREGKTLLTSGAGLAADKTLLYPHHRGIFFGFNKISYDGQQCDIWHGRNGEYQEHKADVDSETSPVHAWQRAKIGWHGKDGKKFAEEIRDVSVYHVPGGTLIDFASKLTTDRSNVRLDGDPQHAGFHFRAAQEVAQKTKSQTYYLRPDGKGQPGETRNWDPKTKKGPVNLPWDAMSFMLGDKRYTVLYMDHPKNPKEARGSERDYGRFGNYFEYDLTPQKPLQVRYRLWIQEGEMTQEQCESMTRGFVAPPKVNS